MNHATAYSTPTTSTSWTPSNFPYDNVYNDHFETPLKAYQDILPLLDSVAQNPRRGRSHHIIYDPYYCNGRTTTLLTSLGFQKIQHFKRDFYDDIKHDKIPHHHTIITNPPYSSDHKQKCLEFATRNLRSKNKAFFILLPNYVLSKEYYRQTVRDKNGNDNPNDILYVIPSTKYEYEHPEGTGHDIPPFFSVWCCGIPQNKVSAAKRAFVVHDGRTAKLVSSWKELRDRNVMPTTKRLNPKRRKKLRQQQQDKQHQSGTSFESGRNSVARCKERKSSSSVVRSNKSKNKDGFSKKKNSGSTWNVSKKRKKKSIPTEVGNQKKKPRL